VAPCVPKRPALGVGAGGREGVGRRLRQEVGARPGWGRRADEINQRMAMEGGSA
jgi:hypothetical protein